MYSNKLNIPLLLISAACGAGTWIIGLILYKVLHDAIPLFVLIAILFFILALVLSGVIYLYSYNAGHYDDNIILQDGNHPFIILGIGLAAVLILGGLFQFIYGLNPEEKVMEPTSYIFLIDESGSMQDNDPEQQRHKAIDSVMQKMDGDFPYAVYCFASDVYLERDMAPNSQGFAGIDNFGEGATYMITALEKILSDLKSGKIDGGEAPRVILLTDGYPSDFRLFGYGSLLNGYKSKLISISTVALGGADTNTLHKIASSTGGVSINVTKASQLADALKEASSAIVTDRDLLSERYMVKNDFLYGLMRVAFLTILGVLIGTMANAAYGNTDSVYITGIATAAKSLIGALVMELGIGLMGMSPTILWLVLWILIAATVGVKTVSIGPDRGFRSGTSSSIIR